jgi:hypothetical protein
MLYYGEGHNVGAWIEVQDDVLERRVELEADGSGKGEVAQVESLRVQEQRGWWEGAC